MASGRVARFWKAGSVRSKPRCSIVDAPCVCTCAPVSSCVCPLVWYPCPRWLLQSEVMPGAWLHYFGCGAMGMLTSFVFIASTQYNTDYAYVQAAA